MSNKLDFVLLCTKSNGESHHVTFTICEGDFNGLTEKEISTRHLNPAISRLREIFEKEKEICDAA